MAVCGNRAEDTDPKAPDARHRRAGRPGADRLLATTLTFDTLCLAGPCHEVYVATIAIESGWGGVSWLRPEGHAGGPMSRSRHVASAIALLGMAAFATWNVVSNGNWTEVVLPFSSQYRADVSGASALAVVCWAGGLGLLTRTHGGLWLGRLGAATIVVLGAWFMWDHVAHPNGSRLFGDPLLMVVPMSALLMGAGIGILVALRPGVDRRASVR